MSNTAERRPIVLVVDDDLNFTAGMQQFLEVWGYIAPTASNADEAAVMIRNNPPDLIMLDVQMPGRSGLQFCRELKSNSLTELIPVIMITSMADAKHRIKGIEAGADDFLNKPFIADELRAVIKSQLRRKLAVDRRLISIQKSAPDHDVDAFISHASEDKDEFVRPLTQSLTSLGVRIWYDEHQLQVGDSLRDAIERGLALSSYGIVVLSPKFFEKRWPQRELSGLNRTRKQWQEGHSARVVQPRVRRCREGSSDAGRPDCRAFAGWN